MDENFTLLLLSQHYPISQQLQVYSYDDLSIDAEVAGILQAAEQQAGQSVLDRVNAYAADAVEMLKR